MAPSEQVQTVVDILRPVKDRILCVVSGNHELRSKKHVDIDPSATIALVLGIEERYRKDFAFMRVALRDGGLHDEYAFFLTHGASENKKARFVNSVEGVDCFITAHTHTPNVSKPTRLVLTQRNRIRMKPVVSVTACSWLKWGGYASRSLYLPTQTSDPQHLELEFTGSNNREGRLRVVW